MAFSPEQIKKWQAMADLTRPNHININLLNWEILPWGMEDPKELVRKAEAAFKGCPIGTLESASGGQTIPRQPNPLAA